MSMVTADDMDDMCNESLDSPVEVLSQPQDFDVEKSSSDEGNFTELSNFINNGGSSIKLTRNFTMSEGESPITVSKNNIVIDGQAHTVNAKGLNKIFIISGKNVVLKNITLINGNSINGGAIRWTGLEGNLENVNFIDCKSPFWKGKTTGEAGGAVSWTGDSGSMSNCYFEGCSAQGGAGGSIHWSGKNGVVNNIEIVNTIMYNCNYGYGANNGAYAICWTGTGGKLLNTKIVNPKKTGYNQRPYVVDFPNGQCWIDNLTITGEVDGYSIYVPGMPVENYIGNIDVNMPIYKYSPTIGLSDGVFTINNVKSGNVTYCVDLGFSKTVEVDENGHFIVDYPFVAGKNYLVKITYNENQFYNEVFDYFDYNITKSNKQDLIGTFSDLNNLIQNSADSTIILDRNYVFTPETDSALINGISISKSVTINGNNHYIDANYYSARMFITNNNAVLSNIIFKNSRMNIAGNAVRANAPINIINCTFDNNWAYDCFGAALNLCGGDSYVEYSTFTNNKAKTGAAIVVNSNNNIIRYSYFSNNSKDYSVQRINLGNDISFTGGYGSTNLVNFNTFLDTLPLRQIDISRTLYNWYGTNSPSVSKYLKANLNYIVVNNVLTVNITFTDSETGNIVNFPMSRQVIYTIGGNSVISDTLNTVSCPVTGSTVIINALIDNEWLTNSVGNSWYVDAGSGSTGEGTQSNPYKTLQSAVNAASNGDTIYVAPGVYTGSGNVKVNINKAVTVKRWGDTGEVIFDGQNKNLIFTLSSNVVLSSLTIRNGKNGNGGAIVIKSNSIIIECIFKDNKANYWGGAIDMNPGHATIINSEFLNNYAPSGGGAISMAAVDLTVINSIFTDNTGGRGGAINSGNANANLNVYSSTFINNFATSDGGAIIMDGGGNITDSIFINNTATNAGGAVCLWDGIHYVNNSVFTNSLSGSGGAIVSILGSLFLVNDCFNSNYAKGYGGAVYQILGELVSFTSDFLNNSAYYDGGAIFVNRAVSIIWESLFNNNLNSYGGGAIHSLDCELSLFRALMLNNISAQLNGLVDTIYLDPFLEFGNYTLVVANTTNYNGTLPSRFSLPENGWDTPVKNQGSLGICWDYSTVAMVETAIKKATGITFDLSESNVKNLISRYSIWGSNRDPNGGGYAWDGSTYFVNSLGPVLESDDPTVAFGFSSFLENVVHVSNIAVVSRSTPLDNDAIKEAVIKYGGVKVSMLMDGTNIGYNYYTTATGHNHAVLIVGWDDNYSKENFAEGCPGDGAWIIKNSWGANKENGGYIYISYYDQSTAWGDLYYVIFNDTVRYNRVYQYDYASYGLRNSGSSQTWYKNTYTSVKNETLSGFSTFFSTQCGWEVSVYVNDELKHTQNGSSISKGYFTFNFDKIVHLNKGDNFTVVVKVNDTFFPYVDKNRNTVPCGSGVSYYSTDGINWNDLNANNQVACIKVFTQNLYESFVTIEEITNVTYHNLVSVNFNVENRTNVSYVIKNSYGQIIVRADNINGNNIVFSRLAAGNYTIFITNKDTSIYRQYTQSAKFTVKKASSSIQISSIESVFYGNDVNVDYSIVNRTSLTYAVKTVDGRTVVPNTSLNNINKVTLSKLDAGKYVFVIINNENENYTGDIKEAEFTIYQITPTLSLSASDVVYTNVLTVNVKSDVSGNYNVKVGKTSKNISLKANEILKVTFDALDAGNYTVILDYDGTVNYASVSQNLSVNVFKAKSNVGINEIVNVTYPSDVEVYYSVSGLTSLEVKITDFATGTSVTLPKNNISNNKISLKCLNVGNYAILINNTGDNNYNSSYAVSNFTVFKHTPILNISAENIIYSNKVVFKVGSDVSGKYNISIADVTVPVDILSGVIKEVVLNDVLDVAAYDVTLSFDGSLNYNAVSKNTTFKVLKANSMVNITSVTDGIYNTLSPIINVDLINAADVSYVISKDGVNLSNGDYKNIKEALNNLGVGEYTINIINAGDKNHDASQDFAHFAVLKATSRVTINPISNIIYGGEVNVEYEILNKTELIFKIYDKNSDEEIKNIQIFHSTDALAITGLPAGNYYIKIENKENDNYNASFDSKEFNVTKSTPVIIVSSANVVYGNALEINVKSNVGGLYIVRVGENSQKISLKADTENKVTFFNLGANHYTVYVDYDETANYTSASENIPVEVIKANSNVEIKSIANVTYPNDVTVEYSIDNLTSIESTLLNKLTGKSSPIHISNDKIILKGLNAGSYSILINNTGNNNYSSSYDIKEFTVSKYIPMITVNAVNVIYPNSVVVSLKSDVSGEYIVKVGKTSKNISLKANTISEAVFDNLGAGNYTVIVDYHETDNYDSTSVNTAVNILKAKSSVSINEISAVIYPGDVEVYYLVSGLTTLEVKITDFGTGVSRILPESNITNNKISLKGLNAGNYTILINNTGNNNYDASFDSKEFVVSKYVPVIGVGAVDVVYPNKLIVNVESDVSGEYTVKVGKTSKNVYLKANTISEVTFESFDAGNYTVIVDYSETGNYASNSINTTVNVLKAGSNVFIKSIDDTIYSNNVVIGYVVSNLTSLEFKLVNKDVGEVLSVPQDNVSENEIVLGGLKVGKYNLLINNTGDDNYQSSSYDIDFRVIMGINNVRIEIESVTYPENVLIKVIGDVDGVYVVDVNGTLVNVKANSNGVECHFGSGTYVANIVGYVSDDYSLNASSTVFDVFKKVNDVELLVENTTLPGDVVIKVKSDVDGEYCVFINSYVVNVSVIGGEGFNTIHLPVGENYKTKTVFYDSHNYTINVDESTFNVVKGVNNIRIEVGSVTYPENVSIKLIADIDGLYEIDINGTSFNVTAGDIVNLSLKPGDYLVKLINTPDNENYHPVVNNVIFSVLKSKTVISKDSFEIITLDNGSGVVVNVKLPEEMVGEISIIVDNKTYAGNLFNGKASINLDDLSPGKFNAVIKYSGDDTHENTDLNIELNVSKVLIPISDNTFAVVNSTNPAFTVNLPDDATGIFTLTVDGVNHTVEVKNGTAIISVFGLSSGKHNVVFIYSGDNKYNGLNKTTTIDVQGSSSVKQSTLLTFAKKKYTFKKKARSKTMTFKVTLKTFNGKKLTGKIVLLKLTKVNKIKLSAKAKKVIKKAKSKVRKAKKAYKKSKSIKTKKALAKAKKDLNKAKKPQTMLKQLKKGKYAVKTNKNGVAKLTLSKKLFIMKKFKGKAKLTATFKDDSSYFKSSKTVKIVIK